MESENYKEIDFHTYCAKCEYKDVDESEDPCFECLETPAQLYSKKPVKFKEKKGKSNNG